MSVIFTRAPLRVSLGGGGTDLPSYYREHGGFLSRGAIDKYVYMLTHTVFQRRYRLKYSEFEEVDDAAEIRHPILREALLRHWSGSPLEIASVADVPAGHRPRLVRLVHGLPAEGARAGRAHRRSPRARSPRRRARSRSTCSGARRQAGPVRRRPRRHLRLHVQPRRHGRRRAARCSRGRRSTRLREQPAPLLHRRDPARPSTILADQDKRTRARRRRDASPTSTARRRSASTSRTLLESRRPRRPTAS